jgi:hypothetical protein
MQNRIFTLCRMITWVVFLRMFWNFISSLPVKRGGSLSFLVGTISNVLVMEIGWTDVGSSNTSLNHLLMDYFFLAEGIWKVHIFRHLFVWFQTSVYTLGEFHKNRNNSTVFEELSVSIMDLTVINICFTVSASRCQLNGICDRQIHNWHLQLFKYSTVIP